MDSAELKLKKPIRLNYDIYLNVFKTNSATITIENINGKQELHLAGMPTRIGDKEVFKLINDKKEMFLLAVNSERALLTINGTEIGTDY